MKRLVSTVGLDKRDWLRYRKQGITGTDAGAIVGMNPYLSAFQVYQDKITDSIEEIDNEAMRQGRDMEEYVASRFEEATGKKVRRANAIYQNEKHPIMLADFDRLVVGENAGLECKTVSPYLADRWANGGIPFHYQMQVQHYLAVSGYEKWYICALVYGKDLIIREINRDEELITNLIAIEENFWYENVVKRVMPDPDGSKACSEAISSMYKSADKEKTVQLPGFNPLLYRRMEIDELIKKLETEKNAIEQKVKLELGDASYGVTEDFRVAWSSYSQNRLDSKRFKEEKPELYESYVKTSNMRRFTVSPAA